MYATVQRMFEYYTFKLADRRMVVGLFSIDSMVRPTAPKQGGGPAIRSMSSYG